MIEIPGTEAGSSSRPRPPERLGPDRRADWVGRLTLWGVSLTLAGMAASGLGSALWLATPLAGSPWFVAAYRGALAVTFAAAGSAAFLLFFAHNRLVPPRDFLLAPLGRPRVHVGLTAYNDEASIGESVREFKACPEVHRVVVVDNNSRDATSRVAAEAGADAVVVEPVPGYGSCCMRALAEAARGADVVILCEGDRTFSAHDVKKFLAYLENCDLVLGTRATQELRETHTQMDWLINPANQIVAKLVQSRFWGVRLTDMGCTYRAMRVPSYEYLMPHLAVTGNHFSPHMFIEALRLRMRVIEIPVSFRIRVGISKGVGSDKVKAARVALRMLSLIYGA